VVRTISYVLRPLPRIVGYGIALDELPCIHEGEPFEPASLDAETVALPARLLPFVWDTVWTPRFPAVIFTGPGFGELTQEDRDVIWRRWGIPVYEQRLTSAGELAAEECDAHDGLHLRPGFEVTDDIEHRRCPCGLAGAMLATGKTADR
jgi:hypothetical protein